MTRRCVAVAFSGGRDSTALLHATLAAASALGVVEVLALHVHHGLSPHADAWLKHCREQCLRWRRRGHRLDFVAARVTAKPAAGQSVEAWARDERYRALHAMATAHGASLVLLAQHRRDQAETLLLQALRGGGVAGLAAMPAAQRRDGITWARPWLAASRESVEAYLRRHRLGYVDDDSNADERWARNRLRLQVWPALVNAFPGAEAALATAAAWAGEAVDALAELAAIDLLAVCHDGVLALVPWRALSPARRSNVLRAWLRERSGKPVAATLAMRLLEELMVERSARWTVGDAEVRSHRGHLFYKAHVANTPPTPNTCARSVQQPAAGKAPPEAGLQLSAAGRYALPGWGGALHIEPVTSGGVVPERLVETELRARSGGERFQLGASRPARSLKKQYQALGLPEWTRAGPLVYSRGELVYVPGLGIDARALGAPHERQLGIRWIPD